MSIKYHISLFFFLAMHFSLVAQRDTAYQTVRQESGEYQTPIIETPSDRLFRSRVPSKWMFKMDIPKVLTLENHGFAFGVEYKFAPSFSIGANYKMRLFNTDRDLGGWLYPVSVAVEGRWYHDMKKRTRAGRSAYNFGGRYLALEGSMVGLTSEPSNIKRIALRYGLQQRILRNRYFDVSVGAGLSEKTPYNRSNVFGLDQRISVGLAAFLPKVKRTNQDSNICDVIHCQDEQFRMFKFDVFNLLDFQTNGEAYVLALNPNIAFEQKIGRSPFSVELDVDFLYGRGTFKYFNNDVQRYATLDLSATGELRWYYNLRKRMLNGQSGNNLSGTFFGLQLNRTDLIKSDFSLKSVNDPVVNTAGGTREYWASNLVWGIQQRLLEHGFIQFKIGAGSSFGGYNYVFDGLDQPLRKVARPNELNIVADLKVGFAF